MKRRSALLALLGIFALVVGCGDPQASENFTIARVVNALVGVPNSANADIKSSDSLLNSSNIAYGQVTTYQNGHFGTPSVTVTTVGTQNVLAGPTSVNLPAKQTSTVIVSGVVGRQGLLAPRIFTVGEVIPTIPDQPGGTGQGASVALRLVNLSPDARPISLYGTIDPQFAFGQLGGLTNISYGNSSEYVIQVTGSPTVTNQDGSTTTLNNYLALRLYDAMTGTALPSTLDQGFIASGGKAYTFFVFGYRNPTAGQPGLSVTISVDN